MKLPFRKIITERNVVSLAAITFQIAKIHSVSKYAPCWELEPFKSLKSLYMMNFQPFSGLKTATIPNIAYIYEKDRFL